MFFKGNRLTSYTHTGANPTAVIYAYDALGRRVKKTVDPAGANIVTQYLYDGDQVIAEYDGSGSLQRRYLYHPAAGIDEPFVYVDETGPTRALFTYHADHQGSIVAMSDSTGAQVEAYAYSPYGEASIATPTTGQPYRYTGRRFDEESGLYYYRARYYHTELGRFLQTDPIGYEDNLNLYAYTGNDPMNAVDPTGQCTLDFGDDPSCPPQGGFNSAGDTEGIDNITVFGRRGSLSNLFGPGSVGPGIGGSAPSFSASFGGFFRVINPRFRFFRRLP